MSNGKKAEAQRIINIKGAANFRDLGGYPTRDGHQVKWNALYRSGHLGSLRGMGMKKLRKMTLHAIVDFRTKKEANDHPDYLPMGPKYVFIPIMDEGSAGMVKEIYERVKKNDFEGFDPDAYIQKTYQQFATTFTAEFKAFFQTILSAKGFPVLWHCQAGKDRTGFSAAVLLRILGVEEEIIFEDYLLSNQYTRINQKQKYLLILTRGRETWNNVRPLWDVKREWLQAAFDEIDKEWGSFENYVREGLDLSQQDVECLREKLLTNV